MMKITCLCILGLLLTGILCVPVAAETGDQGNWSFYIVNNIYAISDVKLNGHGDTGKYQQVYVSDSLDQIAVEFAVTAGPDTNLTITKGSITRLRKKFPGMEQALYAWGGSLTYDVDAGGWLRDPDAESRRDSGCDTFTFSEHLEERGLFHLGNSPGFFIEGPTRRFSFQTQDLHTRYVR